MEMVQFEDILEGLSEFVRIIKASRILSGVLVRYQKKGVVLIFVDWKFFLSASRLIQQSSIILIFHTSHRIQKRNALFLQMLLKLLLYVFLLLLLQKDQKYFVFQVSKYFDLCLFLLFLGKINKREIWTIFLNFKDFIFVDQIICKRFSIIALKKRIKYTCLFLLFLGKINKREIWTIFLNFKDFSRKNKQKEYLDNFLEFQGFYFCGLLKLYVKDFLCQSFQKKDKLLKCTCLQNIKKFLHMYHFQERQLKGRFGTSNISYTRFKLGYCLNYPQKIFRIKYRNISTYVLFRRKINKRTFRCWLYFTQIQKLEIQKQKYYNSCIKSIKHQF
eukprot:TRINITY_DN888_c0_g1_i7.p1 TRINITY_DN888_c0_g1~~TRINITY_DN888_c0_g1_i7.p1  ORF type:complete len:331 (-),score=-12.39 TRINITY_DN888_c0_g1_i7:227-1219(-)